MITHANIYEKKSHFHLFLYVLVLFHVFFLNEISQKTSKNIEKSYLYTFFEYKNLKTSTSNTFIKSNINISFKMYAFYILSTNNATLSNTHHLLSQHILMYKKKYKKKQTFPFYCVNIWSSNKLSLRFDDLSAFLLILCFYRIFKHKHERNRDISRERASKQERAKQAHFLNFFLQKCIKNCFYIKILRIFDIIFAGDVCRCTYISIHWKSNRINIKGM